MQNELDIVCDVSARLERGGLDYMLTGSMAMNYYAQPRMTRDIDLVVALTAQETDKVVQLFTPDFYVSREAVSSSIAQESQFNLIHQESVIKVDCIIRKGSPYRRAEFERRQRITIEDFSTWIASKEDLIIPQALVGEGFPFRTATARCQKPDQHRLRHRLRRTLGERDGVA